MISILKNEELIIFCLVLGADMTKGKLPVSENNLRCGSPEASSDVIGDNVTLNTSSEDTEGSQQNLGEINIAEYVQSLPDFVRNKIAGFVGTGIIKQELIDIENIIHYLVVSRHSNNLKSACESKLLSTLNSANYIQYLNIAERFGLESLRTSSHQIYESDYLKRNNQLNKPTEVRRSSKQSLVTTTKYQSYRAMFTCDTTAAKRSISTVVLNGEQEIKCYRKIKEGNSISKQFKCCCIQCDEEHPPYVYWSFGKSFCRYDPILNKYKKLEPLKFSRSNFCLIAHNQNCYAIGGTCKGRTVRQIEEYDIKKKNWKVVSEIPNDCQMAYSSCVVFQDLIYIFCAATNRENCSQNRTIICVFDPVTKVTHNLQADIPMSFTQIKVCVADSNIYLASDDGDFIRYSPNNRSFVKCCDQLFKCKYFGMYNENGSIFLTGGINEDGKCNNSIRKYCAVSGHWERLDLKLPDCMSVYGTCEVKIPKTACAIVPFYEAKLFEISPM